MTDRQ